MSGPKLVELPAAQDKAASLAVLDRLREAIEDGRVAAFYAVTIGHDDSTEAWCGQVVPTSRLRSMGAVSHLLHSMHAGDA